MVSKNLPIGIKSIIPIKDWCSVGISKREFLCTRAVIWVDKILNYTDTRANLHRHEGSCMVYEN